MGSGLLCENSTFWRGQVSLVFFCKCQALSDTEIFLVPGMFRISLIEHEAMQGQYSWAVLCCSLNCAEGCLDNSHLVCNSNSSVCDPLNGMWTCDDGLKCIHTSLKCDGYPQCQDGSDERQDVCRKCPKSFGYVKSGSPQDATYRCKHRYMGTYICAIPCNGADDMCAGNDDEQLCKLKIAFSILVRLMISVGVAFVLGVVTSKLVVDERKLSKYFCRKKVRVALTLQS